MSTRKGPRRGGVGWGPVVLLLVLIAAGVGAVLLFYKSRHVQTLAVQPGTVVKAFYATGTVRPGFEYVIKSRAQGNLVTLNVREGYLVKKDQVLATVDDRQLKFEVARCKAELDEAEKKASADAPDKLELTARLNEAKQQFDISDREMKRLETMFEKQTASMPDLDAARRLHVQWSNMKAADESQINSYEVTSRKGLAVARANYEKALANEADTEVRSPIDGVVLERYVELNEVVQPNEKLLLVADPKDLLMKAAVDEEDITRTHVGQKVEMQLYSYRDEVISGTVSELFPTSDPANKTYEVRVKFDQIPKALRCGMTAELNFIEEVKENVLTVPTSAVMDGKVYRQNAGGKFEPVDVKIGIQNLEKAEITEGLSRGDEVAVDAKQLAPIKLPVTQGPVVPTRNGDKKEAGI